MRLDIGDHVDWILESKIAVSGVVIKQVEDVTTIQWDNGRVIDYHEEQLLEIMSKDNEIKVFHNVSRGYIRSLREDRNKKLKQLGL